MTTFHNTYHFIPATGKVNNEATPKTPYATIAAGDDPFSRHDLWHKDGHSGRIVCRLHLKTPTFVGSGQTQGKKGSKQPGGVKHYHRNDKPAIPGNSLRGMIGAKLEALSQSALRVLENKSYRVGGAAHDFFGKIDPDLLPWNDARDELTPAERLLGVVGKGQDGQEKSSRNLASRVRFFDGLPEIDDVELLDSVTLKILSSPKPPSPAMYFHPLGKRGQYLSKEQLLKNDIKPTPNGRKVYLPHAEAEIESRSPWKTGNDYNNHQKLKIAPLKAGQDFVFHVDFENLSDSELYLLLLALVPGENHRHRLGLGKPLGLGSVAVQIQGVFLKNPRIRYGKLEEGTKGAPRYADGWKNKKEWQGYENRYPLEATTSHNGEVGEYVEKLQNLSGKSVNLVDDDSLRIVQVLSNPSMLITGIPVCTPFTPAQEPGGERETFLWFKNNDERGHQALSEVKGPELPTLRCDPSESATPSKNHVRRGGDRRRASASRSARAVNVPGTRNLDAAQKQNASEWLRRALESIREQPGQANQSHEQILVSVTLAQIWLDLPEEQRRDSYRELQTLWQDWGIQPGKKAARIYGG